MKSPEAVSAFIKYDKMIDLLKNLEEKCFCEWATTVEEKCSTNLKKSLLLRRKENFELTLNFDPNLVRTITVDQSPYTLSRGRGWGED